MNLNATESNNVPFRIIIGIHYPDAMTARIAEIRGGTIPMITAVINSRVRKVKIAAETAGKTVGTVAKENGKIAVANVNSRHARVSLVCLIRMPHVYKTWKKIMLHR
jgi:prolyl-tRNA synthetase